MGKARLSVCQPARLPKEWVGGDTCISKKRLIPGTMLPVFEFNAPVPCPRLLPHHISQLLSRLAGSLPPSAVQIGRCRGLPHAGALAAVCLAVPAIWGLQPRVEQEGLCFPRLPRCLSLLPTAGMTLFVRHILFYVSTAHVAFDPSKPERQGGCLSC